MSIHMTFRGPSQKQQKNCLPDKNTEEKKEFLFMEPYIRESCKILIVTQSTVNKFHTNNVADIFKFVSSVFLMASG